MILSFSGRKHHAVQWSWETVYLRGYELQSLNRDKSYLLLIQITKEFLSYQAVLSMVYVTTEKM